MTITLPSLPLDILRQIHLYSLSPSLPLVNHSLHSLLSNPSPSQAATWLFRKHRNLTGRNSSRSTELLPRVLSHGICTLGVLQWIEEEWRLWGIEWENRRIERERIERIEAGEDQEDEESEEEQEEDDQQQPDNQQDSSPPSTSTTSLITPTNPFQPLQCPTLPRRLFRSTPFPTTLITHLLTTYTPNINSHSGYALHRSLLTSDIDMIKLLLRCGADPWIKDRLAVKIGVAKRDLGMIRLIMELPVDKKELEEEVANRLKYTGLPSGSSTTPTTTTTTNTITYNNLITYHNSTTNIFPPPNPPNTKVEYYSPKGRRLRVPASEQIMENVMRSGDRALMDYFVEELGYIPSLGDIMKLK